MTFRYTALIVVAISIITLTGCVQRTVYSGFPASTSSGEPPKRKATSSQVHWFWQDEFWTK